MSYAAQYNPQQWQGRSPDGSSTATHASISYAPRLRGPDEPVASPPPPYTPNPSEVHERPSTSGLQHHVSPTPTQHGFPDPRTVDNRFVSPSTSFVTSPNQLMPETNFPPPPGTARTRSTSRNPAQRFMTAIGIGQQEPGPITPSQYHQSQQGSSFAGPSMPPAARRAISTGSMQGALQGNRTFAPAYVTAARVPPPPPGPAPNSIRSQSMSGVGDPSALPTSPPTRRPQYTSALDTVPPTPANWQDGHPQPQQQDDDAASEAGSAHRKDGPLSVRLRLQTQDLGPSPDDVPMSGVDGRANLMRSPAVRMRSAKGIRERRSESRAGKDSASSPEDSGSASPLDQPLKNLDLSRGNSGTPLRRASARITPRTGTYFQGIDQALAASKIDTKVNRLSASADTPISTATSATATPGLTMSGSSLDSPNDPDSRTPKSPLNTTLLQPGKKGLLQSQAQALEGVDRGQSSPLTPGRTQSLVSSGDEDDDLVFAAAAMQRHKIFAKREAAAATVNEKLNLFAEYMRAECILRKQRYANDMGADQDENILGPFEWSMLASADDEEVIKSPRPGSNPVSPRQDLHMHPKSAGLSIDTSSSGLANDNFRRNPDFVPTLSPIASMSAITRHDRESDSRGRAPSRWWESDSGSELGDGFKVLERTKKETKYMSAVLENVSSPAWPTDASVHSTHDHRVSREYGEDEYPPEKVGWHEEDEGTTSNNINRAKTPLSAPFTPDPTKLDISRLITLPPPYPRRHPAVNNNHPDLADIRGVIRHVNDISETANAYTVFEDKLCERRRKSELWVAHQTSLYEQDLKFRQEHGEISPTTATTEAAAFSERLNQSTQELLKAEFDLFTNEVVNINHVIFTERISAASQGITTLVSRIDSEMQSSGPESQQSEGDERPELLERLTMLKWLFEARESIYREIRTLLIVRNDKYKAMVMHPYISHSNTAKIADATSFFANDALQRAISHESGVATRTAELHSLIAHYTSVGIETQSSAFWDIAPAMQSLLCEVPSSMKELVHFEILIPRTEVDENPGYWTHPLRYLWGVLGHAEASSRQFIEGQISLWCLEQEVRESMLRARFALQDSKRKIDGEDDGDGDGIDEELRRGVDELKEKVSVAESQWREGLGGEIERVKDGLRRYLVQSGGWEDDLEE